MNSLPWSIGICDSYGKLLIHCGFCPTHVQFAASANRNTPTRNRDRRDIRQLHRIRLRDELPSIRNSVAGEKSKANSAAGSKKEQRHGRFRASRDSAATPSPSTRGRSRKPGSQCSQRFVLTGIPVTIAAGISILFAGIISVVFRSIDERQASRTTQSSHHRDYEPGCHIDRPENRPSVRCRVG